MSRRVWKAVKTKVGKTSVVKTKRRREEKRRGKEVKIKEEGGKKEKSKKEKNNGDVWDKEEKAAKLEEEVKKLVSTRFYKWIYIFRKKASKRMLMRKIWDYVIDIKKEFVPRKEKVYPLSRKEREEVYKFINEQLRKWYIELLKSS